LSWYKAISGRKALLTPLWPAHRWKAFKA